MNVEMGLCGMKIISKDFYCVEGMQGSDLASECTFIYLITKWRDMLIESAIWMGMLCIMLCFCVARIFVQCISLKKERMKEGKN